MVGYLIQPGMITGKASSTGNGCGSGQCHQIRILRAPEIFYTVR